MAMLALATRKTYQQRNPRATPLYKIIEQYFHEFKRVYKERFQEKYGYWRDAVDKSVESFLQCGKKIFRWKL
jgi:hypothetical protein